MTFSAPQVLQFGSRVAGAAYEPRPAAYVVIRNPVGHVAAVRCPAGYWLPGGGALRGETPAATALREAREELSRQVRLLGNIGTAVQYFYAANDGKHYEMTAVFFRAEFAGAPLGAAEYDLHWLDVSGSGRLFFHECHDWALRQDWI